MVADYVIGLNFITANYWKKKKEQNKIVFFSPSLNYSLYKTNVLKTMVFMKEVIITLRKKIAYTAGHKLQQFKKMAFHLCSDPARLMICEET